MQNKMVVIVNGLARGGTNILWNIIASHPKVCLPRYETGEIIKKSRLLKWLFREKSGLNSVSSYIAGIIFDRQCYHLKIGCLTDKYHKYSSENQIYRNNEISDTVLCLKSLDEEIELSNFFRRIYPSSFFIGIVRNGYALCDGLIRRGLSAEESAKYYTKYIRLLIEQEQIFDNYKIVRFEKVIADPFCAAEHIYDFLELKPPTIPKLRLKSKRVIGTNGAHKLRYGQLNAHYWFDREEIKNFLDIDIDKTQSNRLSKNDCEIIQYYAKDELEHFEYQ
jgi:hypothetical protein